MGDPIELKNVQLLPCGVVSTAGFPWSLPFGTIFTSCFSLDFNFDPNNLWFWQNGKLGLSVRGHNSSRRPFLVSRRLSMTILEWKYLYSRTVAAKIWPVQCVLLYRKCTYVFVYRTRYHVAPIVIDPLLSLSTWCEKKLSLIARSTAMRWFFRVSFFSLSLFRLSFFHFPM